MGRFLDAWLVCVFGGAKRKGNTQYHYNYKGSCVQNPIGEISALVWHWMLVYILDQNLVAGKYFFNH